MPPIRLVALAIALLVTSAAAPSTPAAPTPASRRLETRNVVLVVTDGVRWQEVFSGADSSLLFGDPARVGGDTASVRRDFWRPGAAERRAALLPFLWGTVGRRGQLFGNFNAGSRVLVTNRLNFSYPGYNEMLAGFADTLIDSNEFGPNPNVTVFEWLNQREEYRGRVAAFATWDVFDDIFARDRSGIVMHTAWEQPYPAPRDAHDSLMNRLYATAHREWSNNAWDSFMHAVMMRHVRAEHPRVLFVGYGETDEWAHAGRYDRYLRAARRVDTFIAELWSFFQSHPDYRGKTTMIITTDHGRGRTPRDWSNHGADVPGAEEMWLAIIGPDTPALGERTSVLPVIQSQVASTLAAFLGIDYRGEMRRPAPAIADVVK
jgi:hypothetical protein